MKLFIKRFISVYVIFFTTSFPIHFDSWLNFPVQIAKYWEGINKLLFSLVNLELNSPILSDSKGLYLHLLSLLVISFLISFIWATINNKENKIRSYYFYTYVTYYLALQLIIYGLNKIFLLQFPSPTANILFTNVGAISKDFLFWTAMSSSPLYNYFMGGVELLGAILLLFSRTRLLGTILSIGIFLNIVFINFSFDISVKVYSLFLLFSSFYLISPCCYKLYRFFIKNELVKLEVSKLDFKSFKYRKILPFIKIIIFSFFLYVGFKPYFDLIKTDDHINFLEAYKVIDFKVNGEEVQVNNLAWNRIYFHPKSYFIIEDNQEKFFDYQLVISSSSKQLILNNKTAINYRLKDNGYLKLIGIWNKKAIAVTLEPIDYSQLPLLKEQFHWAID